MFSLCPKSPYHSKAFSKNHVITRCNSGMLGDKSMLPCLHTPC